MSRLLLTLLFAGLPAALAGADESFTPRCAAVMQKELPKRPPAELETYCGCGETRASAAGVTETALLDYVEALERDPKAPAPPAIRGAFVACFEEEIGRMNEKAREDYERRAAERNQSLARVEYRWTAWIRSKGPLQEFQAPEDAWEVEVGGVPCRLEEARTREHRDGAHWVRNVSRTLDCPGAEVTVTGTQLEPGYTGCSHTRDGKLGIEGGARFEVRPRSGDAPGGWFMLACDRAEP